MYEHIGEVIFGFVQSIFHFNEKGKLNMEMIGLAEHACILLISAQAALSDIRSWRVSNVWILVWSAAGFAFDILFFGGAGIADRCIGAAIPVILLWAFFMFRMIGAGDIKLLALLGIWLKADGILWCLLFSFAAGAAISFARIMFYKNGKERFSQLGNYFIRLINTGIRTGYDVKNAGKARVHVAVYIFIGVLLKVVGVY